MLAADPFLPHESNSGLGQEFAMLIGMGAHGGEWRRGKGGTGHVIISDDGNIVRHGESGLPDGEHGSDRNRIVARKEGRGARMFGEDVFHGLVAACKAKVCLGDERLLVGKACVAERGSIALQTPQSGDIVQ